MNPEGRPPLFRVNKGRAAYYLAGLISLITLIVYLPTLRNDFVIWDDDIFVYNNRHIRSLDWTFFRWAFTDISLSYWRPVVWISHALDYAIWGLNPMGHHLTNVLLHAANTFMAVFLIFRFLDASRNPPNREGDGREAGVALNQPALLIAAGVTGVLFGLHPLHVESVAWITERKDLLYSLFFLLSVGAYINHAIALERPAVQKESRGFFLNRFYILSLGFFVLALASKPMAITLPFVLLILDRYPFQRIRSLRSLVVSLVEKVPFIVLSLLVSIIALIAQALPPANTIFLESASLPERVLIAFKSLVVYLWKMVVPLHLIPFYPYPKNISFLSLEYFSAIIIVSGITAACIFTAKKQKIFLTVWGYYLITLLPVLGIIQIGDYSMADRYTYLPSLGPFLLIGLFVAWGWAKTDALKQWRQTAKLLIVAIGISLVGTLAFLTLKQISIWKNTIDLWSYVIEREPFRVPIAYNNRGLAFKESGQIERAMEDYNTSIALAPDAKPYTNRGIIFGEAGQLDKAIKDFDTAIALNPTYAIAYISRGFAFVDTGHLDRAIEDFNKAITLDPFSADAYLDRGVAFEKMGQLQRAIEDYDKAVALNPSDPLGYCNRGIVFSKMGRVDQAMEDFDKALSLNQSFAKAYLERGDLFLKTGNSPLAIRDYQKACTLGSEVGCEALRTYKGQ